MIADAMIDVAAAVMFILLWIMIAVVVPYTLVSTVAKFFGR